MSKRVSNRKGKRPSGKHNNLKIAEQSARAAGWGAFWYNGKIRFVGGN